MHRNSKWLLALSLAALLAPAPLLAAEEGNLSGAVEVGAAGVAISDDAKRVNEYSVIRADQGVNAYGQAEISGVENGIAVDAQAEYLSNRDQQYNLGLDVKRIFRFDSSYQTFLHWLDHDQLNYINAAIPGGNTFPQNNPAAGAPTAVAGVGTFWNLGIPPNDNLDEALNPNNVPGFIGIGQTTGTWYAFNPAAGVAGAPATLNGESVTWQQLGRASVFAEDFVPGQDFMIKHREYKNRAELVIPQLPNLIFHAGYRVEQREGTEQSIGMSKCTSCHITGSSKEIDEETTDLTAGVTGKFGLLTFDYTYLDREFREHGADPTRLYDPALSPSPATTYTPTNGTFDNRLLYDYEDGLLRYDITPDSDKESHVLKAKVDLPRNVSVLGTYVKADVESRKTDEPGIFTLADDLLETTYDAYGMKAAAKLTKDLTVTVRGRLEEISNDDAVITFFPMGTSAQPNLGGGTLPASIDGVRESVISRDVMTLGTDAVYRLARYTTLRLGYEYQEIDREDEHFGTTESHEVTASIKARPIRNLTTRASYTYKNIDNPLQNTDAAGYIDPATGLPYTNDPTFNVIGSGPLYGTAFYDQRQIDLSNLPEDVHEGKASATWSPRADMAVTLNLRAKFEENELDRSTWEQTTFVPGVSLWYAPTQKINLTFAYNYLGQSTESKFCQGWYDG